MLGVLIMVNLTERFKVHCSHCGKRRHWSKVAEPRETYEVTSCHWEMSARSPVANSMSHFPLVSQEVPNRHETAAHNQKFFWCVLSTKSPKMEQTNICVQLRKNPSSYDLSGALSEHPFACVCFSKMFIHRFVPAKHHPTQLIFQRTFIFPLQFCVAKQAQQQKAVLIQLDHQPRRKHQDPKNSKHIS